MGVAWGSRGVLSLRMCLVGASGMASWIWPRVREWPGCCISALYWSTEGSGTLCQLVSRALVPGLCGPQGWAPVSPGLRSGAGDGTALTYPRAEPGLRAAINSCLMGTQPIGSIFLCRAGTVACLGWRPLERLGCLGRMRGVLWSDLLFLEATPLKWLRPWVGSGHGVGCLLSAPLTPSPELWGKPCLGSCEASHLDDSVGEAGPSGPGLNLFGGGVALSYLPPSRGPKAVSLLPCGSGVWGSLRVFAGHVVHIYLGPVCVVLAGQLPWRVQAEIC